MMCDTEHTSEGYFYKHMYNAQVDKLRTYNIDLPHERHMQIFDYIASLLL